MAEFNTKRLKPEGAEDPAVTRFREFLRIKTVQPNPDYDGSTAFLKAQAEDLGLQFRTWRGASQKTVVVMTLEGTEPTVPSLMLNSHVDVVPVFEKSWKHDPFGAHKDELGNIYARGSQDMKSVSCQYLEAIRVIKHAGTKLRRTIHLTFVPDEEVGGYTGMGQFVESELFKSLNVGCALDEGLASETDVIPVYQGERTVWWFKVTAKGNPGHGSRFIKATAVEKLLRVIDTMMKLRKENETKLEAPGSNLLLGDVVSVNLTMLEGGVQLNVVPAEVSAGFDMRFPPSVKLDEFKKQFDEWTSEEGVSVEFSQVAMKNSVTPLDDTNPWWLQFEAATKTLGLKINKEIFPAGTDSRFLRDLGIPAIGFSPMPNTPILLHDHNEFLNENTFLAGIPIFVAIITSMANTQ